MPGGHEVAGFRLGSAEGETGESRQPDQIFLCLFNHTQLKKRRLTMKF